MGKYSDHICRLWPNVLDTDVDSVDIFFCVAYRRTQRIRAHPKKLSTLRKLFLNPRLPKHSQYEGQRAIWFRGPSVPKNVDRGLRLLQQLLHVILSPFSQRKLIQPFFSLRGHDPQYQPQKSAARDILINNVAQSRKPLRFMRSVRFFKDSQCPLSPTGVRESPQNRGVRSVASGGWMKKGPKQPRPTVDEPVGPMYRLTCFPWPRAPSPLDAAGLFLFVAELVEFGRTQKVDTSRWVDTAQGC